MEMTYKHFLQRTPVRDWLTLALLATGVAALYGPHLNAPLVFDDIDFFGSNYASRVGGNFSPLALRYWSTWTFAFQRIVFGDDPAMFRLVNVALHLMVGAALFLFIRTLHALVLTGDSELRGQNQTSRHAIWLAVALFLFHPVAVYGVAYLVERSILMATLFCLLMWWAHLRGLASGKPGWLALAALFYYFALYSKEHSVMAPAVALLLTLLIPHPATGRRLLVLVFLAYFALALSVVLTQKNVIASAYEPWLLGGIKINHAYLTSVLTQAALYFKYLFLWWVPLTSWMSIDIREPLKDIASIWTWLSLCGFIGYCALGFVLLLRRRRLGLLGFSMLAPALLFMTELATVRIQESFVLYRSYLWLPPMLAGLPLIFQRLAGRGRQAALLLGWGCAGICFYLAAGRLYSFSSGFLLWDEAIKLADKRGDTGFRERQYVNRGGTYLVGRNFDLALQDFERALQWNSTNVLALLGQGQALSQLGHPAQAKVSFDHALRLKPGWVDAYLARAALSIQLGDRQAAIADFGRACAERSMFACYAKEKMLGTSGPITITIPRP
ncbi:MAG: hypothetical protein HY066_05290 [Betaproteobacteria bacterium]|nr:hypothetical protein [Betaproteobacteria bacterium]